MGNAKKLSAAAVAAALTATASVGIASGQTDSPLPSGVSGVATPAGVVAQASAEQVEAFNVLGTTRTADDVVRVRVGSVSQIEQSLREVARGNLQLARRIGDSDAEEPAWLVPGDGQLCVVTDEVQRASYQCVKTAVAASGDALQIRSGGPQLKDGIATVSKLLPDGVESVTIAHSGGSVETRVPVVRNWMQTTVKDPSSVGFDRDGVHRTTPLGELPE